MTSTNPPSAFSSLCEHSAKLKKLQRKHSGGEKEAWDFEELRDVINSLLQYIDNAGKESFLAIESVDKLSEKLESILENFANEDGYKDLVNKVRDLRSRQLYTNNAAEPGEDSPDRSSEADTSEDDGELDDDIADAYRKLTETEKNCLNCFFLFPCGAEIKKREVIHCWIAMDYIQDDSLDAHTVLSNLVEAGLIERSIKDKRLHNRYKMPVTVWSKLPNPLTNSKKIENGFRYISSKLQQQSGGSGAAAILNPLRSLARKVSLSRDHNNAPATGQGNNLGSISEQSNYDPPVTIAMPAPDQINSPAPASLVTKGARRFLGAILRRLSLSPDHSSAAPGQTDGLVPATGLNVKPVEVVSDQIASPAQLSGHETTGPEPASSHASSPASALGPPGNPAEAPIQTDGPPPDDKIEALLNDQHTTLNTQIFQSISKKKNLKMLHLGNWRQHIRTYIAIEDPDKNFKQLRNTSNVRFLSLEGVSGIVKLPASIYDLKSLKVLNLRACHNLEFLPKGIDKLINLTHLDVSQCYLLDQIPKEIIALTNLQVLKGFIITLANQEADGSNSRHRNRLPKGKKNQATDATACLFDDLKKLKNLRKLLIRTRRMDFPDEQDLNTLSEMNQLKRLRVAWVGNPKDATSAGEGKFPASLSKLELQAAPQETASRLLRLISGNKHNYNLEKLYIRGGDLKEIKHTFFHVKLLRLRYLASFNTDWDEINKLFPRLGRLEVKECPNFRYYLGDQNGVWEKVKHENTDAN